MGKMKPEWFRPARMWPECVAPTLEERCRMPLDFTQFDSRNYPTLSPRDGYGEWAGTYEQTVMDEMDLRLMSQLATVPWGDIDRAIDLGCGTGRTGAWLHEHGLSHIDGIDITPEMIEQAEKKGVYKNLVVGDIRNTEFDNGSYNLAIASLVDEHLVDIEPLYCEAARIIQPGGYFVLVGYHPHFIMTTGMPTHFHRTSGEAVAIETHIHLLSDHIKAAYRAGFSLIEMDEAVIDEDWTQKKPKWSFFQGTPISFAFVWRRRDQELDSR